MKRFIKLLALAVGTLCSIHSVHATPQIPYHQQALLNERVGFAEHTTGGAGGEIYWVTSNADTNDPGTLRHAVSGDDPRWIMFAVSMNISPASRIDVGANKTIDGRGASVSIFYRGFNVRSRNVIIENLNFKGGGGTGTQDGVTILDGGGDVWIDHCSFNSWTDECIGVTTPLGLANMNVTISWCKFFSSEYGILIGGEINLAHGEMMRVTLHHNWFNGTNQRHPRIRKALVHAYNNYLYDWFYNGMFVTNSGELRVENNIFHANRTDANAVAWDGGKEEGPGFTNTNNNLMIDGDYDEIREHEPDEVFWPNNEYDLDVTPEEPNPALITKITTRAGATRSSVGFLNMSTRANVQSDQGALISGMLISGPFNNPKKVVIRAIGPSLGIAGAMSDTQLRIFNGAGQEIDFNDNWRETQEAELLASGLAPSHNLEAAVLLTLNPGNYTAVIPGVGTGIASIEVYDADPSGPAKLLNISARATVDPNSPPIAGLIGGAGITKLLLRGIGPSLGSAGIQNPIQDPTLELRDANGALIDDNDDWADDQYKAIVQTGAAPTDSREAAILIDLVPGVYTAILRNASNDWGIGLIETYKL